MRGVSSKILKDFIVSEEADSRFSFGLQEVEYGQKYPDLPFFPSSGEDPNQHANEILGEIFKIKSSDWSYEEEFRLVMFSKNGGPIRDNERTRYIPEGICEVILGLSVSKNTEREIRKFLRKGIALKRAKKVPGKFALKIV